MNDKVKMILAIVCFVFAAAVFVIIIDTTTRMLYTSIPSEGKCQSINGYGMQEKAYAEKLFCEYNESGWHFNKTRYHKMWENMSLDSVVT